MAAGSQVSMAELLGEFVSFCHQNGFISTKYRFCFDQVYYVMGGGKHALSQKRKTGKRGKDENANERQRLSDDGGVVNPHQAVRSRRDSGTTQASILSNSQTVRGQSTDSSIPPLHGVKYAQLAVSYQSSYRAT